ncbi:Hypothetical predicted protein [Xyrichtys novacula]|uniref:Secreted protein n=1 Tax=Xyrichtys novacula TaxID=13765 RepID=A0AAV1GIC8_XYRNO|nr:Hypothetical predicted protein [Xyrichtys novacula]
MHRARSPEMLLLLLKLVTDCSIRHGHPLIRPSYNYTTPLRRCVRKEESLGWVSLLPVDRRAAAGCVSVCVEGPGEYRRR